MSRIGSSHTLPRLYVPDELITGQHVGLNVGQTHYLCHVMRLKEGDAVRLFNGRDGEWQAAVGPGKKRLLEVTVHEQLKPQTAKTALRLCCAPIKRAHFDAMIMKATELGVSQIQPILTARTQVRDVNLEHARAIAIEAAEQSERLSLPDIKPPLSLEQMAAAWSNDCLPVVCAEWGEAMPVREAFSKLDLKDIQESAIITGPEGGFAPKEMQLLRALPRALPIRLGPSILRADTAAIAALTCWQALCGDWR